MTGPFLYIYSSMNSGIHFFYMCSMKSLVGFLFGVHEFYMEDNWGSAIFPFLPLAWLISPFIQVLFYDLWQVFSSVDSISLRLLICFKPLIILCCTCIVMLIKMDNRCLSKLQIPCTGLWALSRLCGSGYVLFPRWAFLWWRPPMIATRLLYRWGWGRCVLWWVSPWEELDQALTSIID